MATQLLKDEIHRLQHELQSLKAAHMPGKISIGGYILARLEQLGVTVSLIPLPVIATKLDLRFLSLCLAFPVTSIWVFW